VPVHVEQVTSDVAVFDRLPFTEAQLRELTRLVAARLREQKRDERERSSAAALDRRTTMPKPGERG
jgi:hypothetical protein